MTLLYFSSGTPSSYKYPANSKPMIGLAAGGGGYCPFLWRMSALLTAVAICLTRTSSWLSVGSGLSPIRRVEASPFSLYTIAFIIFSEKFLDSILSKGTIEGETLLWQRILYVEIKDFIFFLNIFKDLLSTCISY